MPSSMTWPVYSPAIGKCSLPTSLRAAAGLVQHRGKSLLDVIGLAFLDDKHRVLALAEVKELVVDQRIDGVQHIERDVCLAIGVGKTHALQRADDRIVHAALHDDAHARHLRARRIR